MSFACHFIKRHETLEHLGCQLYSKLNGEAMTSKVLKTISAKLNFLYRQSRPLTSAHKRLLCNALIWPSFDCGCSSWLALLKKNLKLNLQKAKDECTGFCLNLPPRSHIDPSQFRKINCLPVNGRVDTVLSILSLSTRMELYHDIFMKCLSLHPVDIAQHHSWHWTHLCGKQIQGQKAYAP